MSKKIIILTISVITIGLLIIVFPKISLYLNSVKKTNNTEEVTFYFENKNGLEELATNLVESKIINNKNGFISVGEYKNLDRERLAAGKYIIRPKTKIKDLLNGFTKNSLGNGNAEAEVTVTFNHCKTVEDVISVVSKQLMLDSTALSKKCNDLNYIFSLGFTKEQFPSLFLPNSYQFFWDTNSELFLERMTSEYKKFWTADRKSKIKEIGLNTASEVSTLASIVYSEQSRIEEEWSTIAGLYLNRIKQGILLQSDPTFKFCWGNKLDTVQRLLYVHRDIDCPYNTYKYKGLPPGPICIVPAATIDAVLKAEKNNYIYMIAQANQTLKHHFTDNYEVHKKNARIYQKWLAAGQPN